MADKKTVLITGGAKGIGAACALAFAEKGYNVAVNYRSSEAEAVALEGRFANIKAFKADVSDGEQVDRLFEQVNETFGGVDILINNAGVPLFGLFQCVERAAAEKMYATNLFGTLNCSRRALPFMLAQQNGVIINISSVWGEVGASCEVDYSAAKAAVIGFTKALSKEVGFSGVRVNCVTPGVIDTDMNASLSVEDVSEIVDSVPLERLGTPEDVAAAVLFLSSEAASYITGQVLGVNGGWTG